MVVVSCVQEAVESVELDTVLNVDVHSKLHVLYGGTKVVQHTPPSKTGPGLKGTSACPMIVSSLGDADPCAIVLIYIIVDVDLVSKPISGHFLDF